jgi:lactoylglutathione lyase
MSLNPERQRQGHLARAAPWFIMRRAGLAPCRRRPVSSTLGRTNNTHRTDRGNLHEAGVHDHLRSLTLLDKSLSFFEAAFGLKRKFLHESGTYGELDTGETTLSFAAHELGDMNFSGGHVRASESQQPLGIEIALVTHRCRRSTLKAVQLGAQELAPPVAKPWGQVGLLRAGTPDGTLIELCTPNRRLSAA